MSSVRRGFTLLEILVVLAILGMGMAIISSMMRNSAQYSERVEEDTQVQLTCDNMMSSILSGNMTATLGVELPIPDAPNWTVKVELLDGPIESLVAVRITAQRYDQMEIATANNAGLLTTARTPTAGRTFVIKEWARRANVRTRVVSIAADGSMTAVDGSGETVANDVNPQLGIGGSLEGDDSGQGVNGSLFDSLDTSLGLGGGLGGVDARQDVMGQGGTNAGGGRPGGGALGGGSAVQNFSDSPGLTGRRTYSY